MPIEPGDAVPSATLKQMTPDGVGIENPAFDVTPSKYVTGIITERGVLTAPYVEAIEAMAGTTELVTA